MGTSERGLWLAGSHSAWNLTAGSCLQGCCLSLPSTAVSHPPVRWPSPLLPHYARRPGSQVHGGLVAMDFSQAGQERYQSLDSSLLPALHLIHRPAAPSGKDSGSVHSDVKRRWLEGDASVR